MNYLEQGFFGTVFVAIFEIDIFSVFSKLKTDFWRNCRTTKKVLLSDNPIRLKIVLAEVKSNIKLSNKEFHYVK